MEEVLDYCHGNPGCPSHGCCGMDVFVVDWRNALDEADQGNDILSIWSELPRFIVFATQARPHHNERWLDRIGADARKLAS